MRIVTLGLVLVIGGSASAQPPSSQPPVPPTYPPQQPYAPPPQQYQPAYNYPVQLSADDHELLMRGEITDGEHFGGGLAALFLGFGSGQAIQGRWSDTGWIFTLGETASLVAMVSGAIRIADDCIDTIGDDVDCDHSDGPPLMIIGALGITVFRIWGTVDAFSGPGDHNRRVRELKWRMGMPVQVGVTPYVNRTRDGGGTAGVQIRF